MTDLGRAAFDHTASLQQQVDRLAIEIEALAFVGLALAVTILILSWRVWQR